MEIETEYDRQGDVLYMKFKEPEGKVAPQVLSEKIAEYIPLEPEDIVFDFDEAGKLVGMEILAASEYFEADFLSRAQIPSMPLPSLGESKPVEILSL